MKLAPGVSSASDSQIERVRVTDVLPLPTLAIKQKIPKALFLSPVTFGKMSKVAFQLKLKQKFGILFIRMI